jgi:tetratricopeptide (TPR) repeat protein
VDAAYFNRALALEALGRHRERLESLESAMQTCLDLGDVTALAIAQVSYASALHVFGEYDRAEGLLLEAYRTLASLDVSGYWLNAESALVHLYLDWQPVHGKMLVHKHANAALVHARALGGNRYITEALCLVSRAELWTGSVQRALEYSDEALSLARAFAVPVNLVDALDLRGRVLAALGRKLEALQAFQEAHTIAFEREDLSTAQTVMLEVDRMTGDLESARERQAWFAEREMISMVNTVRRYFPEGSTNLNAPGAVNTAPVFKLEILGPMRFGIDGRMETLRGRKRQELLAMLVEAQIAGQADVSRLDLIELLYPDASEDQATSALKSMVGVIRANLGADVIRTTTNGYALGTVVCDAKVFLETGETHLWRGAYLDGVVLDARDAIVRESLHLALYSKAQSLLQADPKEAARVGRILLEFDGYNLEYLSLNLQALRANDNHRTISRVYAEARDRLLEVGEVIPERWQDYLVTA